MSRKKAIGIDLGTSKCCVGIFRNGKVEILENERGNKTTPSYVAFTGTERLVGEDAKDQVKQNPTNTIFGVKRIIGRELNDGLLKEAVDKMPYTIVHKSEGETCIHVSYKDTEVESLLPQQITAMLLGKMKDLAEHHLKNGVEDAVISVPASFSNAQRQATKDAAAIAGLKVLALINEPTAAAIAYQANRRKTVDENVAVVDFGAGKLDVAIVTVRRDRVNVKAVSGSTAIGGDDIDEVLMEYVSREFEGKFKKKLPESPAMTERLRSCCEKLKRKLSLLPKVQETLDCFGDDNVMPVTINIKDFNAMVPEVVQSSLRNCLRRATQASGIFLNLSRVVLVGGSSRIPLFQTWLEEMFGLNSLDRSVNPDEAVAYGATLYAALLSGDNELDEFVVEDCVPNDYCFTSNGDNNMQPVFEQHSSITLPQRRVFLFNGQSPFNEKTRAHTFELYEELTGQKNPHRRIGTLSLEDEFRQAVSIISDVTFEVDRCGIFNAVVRLRPHHVFAEVVKNLAGKLSRDQLMIAVEREQQFRRDDLEEKKRIEAMSSLEALSFRLQSMNVVDTKAKELFPELVNRIGDEAKENILWLDATNNVPKTQCVKREKILQELHNTLVLQLQEHEKKERERVAVVYELKNYLGKLEAFTSGSDVSEECEETAEIERQVALTKHWLQSTKTPSKHEVLEKCRRLEKLYKNLETKLEERRKETERITAVSNLKAYCHHVEEILTCDLNDEDNRDLADSVLDQVRAKLGWLHHASDISAAVCDAEKSSLQELYVEMKRKVLTRKADKEAEKRRAAIRRLRSYCKSLSSSVVTCNKYKNTDPDLVKLLENEVNETLRWLCDERTASQEIFDDKFSALETLEATLKASVESRLRNETNRNAAQQKFEIYFAGLKVSFPVLKKVPNKDDKLVQDIFEQTQSIRRWLENGHTFSNADYELKFGVLSGLVSTLRNRMEDENQNTLTDESNNQLDAFKTNNALKLSVQSNSNESSVAGNVGHNDPANGAGQASRQVGTKQREDREDSNDATSPRSAKTDGKQNKDDAGGKNEKSWYQKRLPWR